MINIIREYLGKEFADLLEEIPNSSVQSIINDFILLMAFVGNDFLPV
jgi:5'-3' exonuclease